MAEKEVKEQKENKEVKEKKEHKEGKDKAAEATAAGSAPVAEPVKKKKTSKKNISSAYAYVLSSFNNTIITFTDTMGNVICWSSAGSKGFKGSRKNTPFAAQVAAEDATNKAIDCGVREVFIKVSGPGAGRESALRGIQSAGVRVSAIKDITPVPHNGCRPPKRRRV